ncbi:MAG: hypothetical protein HKN23_11240 [Verrucomicrobiales bacterium]|nr:hypothetical protein [Verrucomicrobiales bacterium]
MATAEYRGSTLVERYLEPHDPELPDYAKSSDEENKGLHHFYKLRVINHRRFTP